MKIFSSKKLSVDIDEEGIAVEKITEDGESSNLGVGIGVTDNYTEEVDPPLIFPGLTSSLMDKYTLNPDDYPTDEDLNYGFEQLRLRYVPPPNVPHEEGDEYDAIHDVQPDILLACIEEMLDDYYTRRILFTLPCRTRSNPPKDDKSVTRTIDHPLKKKGEVSECNLPADSTAEIKFIETGRRYVYCGKVRKVAGKIGSIVAALLELIKDMLMSDDGSLSTPRDFYYSLRNKVVASTVSSPERINNLLLDLCCLWKCTRSSIKLAYAPSKCEFAGNVKYTEIDEDDNMHTIDCSKVNKPYKLQVEYICRIEASAYHPNFILIVEKDTIFYKLVKYKFNKRFPCVIVSGCGQPDVQCRRFVNMLHQNLKIPVLALVDFNPYGIEIMRSFKVGSYDLAHESFHLTVPNIEFIGLSGDDLMRWKIPRNKLTSVTEKDISKAISLSQEPWMKNNQHVYNSLVCNLDWKMKADLELLYNEKGRDFLHKIFLPVKVMEGMKAFVIDQEELEDVEDGMTSMNLSSNYSS